MTDLRAFVMAEAGVNHNRSVPSALKMIEASAVARADAVTFQRFCAEAMVCRSVSKVAYQILNTDPNESYGAIVR